MVANNQQRQKLKVSAVDLAIAALEGNPSPLDMNLEIVNSAPTSLDLPGGQFQTMCCNPRCSSPAMDACAWWCSPTCGDCE